MCPNAQASPRVSASAPLDTREQALENFQTWDRIALSFEVIPPRAGKAGDLEAIDEVLETINSYQPDYVCVTSSRSSGWLEGTTSVISRITENTRLRTVAHLACTAGDREEIIRGINELLDVGVRGILALRGDLPEGTTRLPEDHLQHATDLITLIRQMEARQAARFAGGSLAVGVACYPSGHAESKTADEDIDVLLAKQRLGANFAITQMFFDPSDYSTFVEKARLAGVHIPLIPGIMPMTSVPRLRRMGKLAGLSVPDHLISALDEANRHGGAEAEHDVGMDLTADLARQCLEAGAGGLHIYTHNKADVTNDLLSRVGIQPKN